VAARKVRLNLELINFEMFGQWALYHKGWMLSTKVNRAPWQAFGPANPDPLNNQVFQLYNLSKDFSQVDDIAAQNPQKVEEMKQMFIAEAKKYQSFRSTHRWRPASSRRDRTSPPAATSSHTRGR
jgi:arylsulfatase A-like enzyme